MKYEKRVLQDRAEWVCFCNRKRSKKLEKTGVEEIIERQLKKYKNKIVDKKQAAVAFSDLFINEEYDSNDEVDIVKVKKFAMKPMDPEEACVQMELLGHSFYVFLNSETEQVNVVYKRKGNTYGLIEPEF